jgi:hypothetical protein
MSKKILLKVAFEFIVIVYTKIKEPPTLHSHPTLQPPRLFSEKQNNRVIISLCEWSSVISVRYKLADCLAFLSAGIFINIVNNMAI